MINLQKSIILFFHNLGTIRRTCCYESVESDDTVPQRFTTNTEFVSVGIEDFPTPYDFSCAYAVQTWRRLPAKSLWTHDDENGYLDVIAPTRPAVFRRPIRRYYFRNRLVRSAFNCHGINGPVSVVGGNQQAPGSRVRDSHDLSARPSLQTKHSPLRRRGPVKRAFP